MLSQLPITYNSNLLSQEIPFADSAIYRLSDNQALVQSVDFFTPVVDDPYRYGQIAAANSLSDVYAVGAKPILALNLVSFPVNCLGPDVLLQILQGGAERVQAAGAVIAGGHSIEDDEPKYGLSVTGLVDPGQMVTACGCQPGDRLILTKPLGTGLLTTALKGGMLSEDDMAVAIEGMAALNRDASEAMLEVGVSGCTDITGFGLAGHASEMASASQVAMKLFVDRLPLYPQARDMAEMGLVPVGAHRNRKFYFSAVRGQEGCDPIILDILSDPQTSGGLLIAVSPQKALQLQDALKVRGVAAFVVGEVCSGEAGTIILEG